ncbi:hypothetical protein [Corynebacterium flavescens]|uniref:hypothetical protein n=1 Tax=Corynebacterium flavescens TaxID=28028 RepID=UPI0026479841|nr:hypothetical protein [Corynebacterium flavescens]MDN6199345.1 hypothetical protein [Corynebacterium flavescens]MDN6227424.1 hypothetical protein [Corynebacterium flavescens]MDN6654765.1 hypothetical protein [Bifidobacterium crudilactis]
MSDHLELAVFRILSRQQQKQFPEWDGTYYTGDLLQDIISDPRITDADLDLKAYAKLLGPDAMAVLLKKHVHDAAN